MLSREEENAILKQAAEIMRSRRDPEKLKQRGAEVGAGNRGRVWTEEQKAVLRQSQKARRDREKLEQPHSNQ